ncbi:hypothetical protein KZX46_17220 [Polymorphobacter sp. PAMC 29334]|uniref:hypothetical protein n=1 Tax=Polymorphobacter sp. PAMC 29334 TaxID=2862331 RepID=UPI001C75C07F|nr:hypothetical protein [Polymorphobacter sp. PAMC 29334]QYE34492.1 hypothetical protein KZX46_17220 [Polymorphobacter sp. PAMC 29334]
MASDDAIDKAALDAAKASLASLAATLTFPVASLLLVLVAVTRATTIDDTINVFGVVLSRLAAVTLVTVALFASFIHAARQVMTLRLLRTTITEAARPGFDTLLANSPGIINPFAAALDPAIIESTRLAFGPEPRTKSLFYRSFMLDNPINIRLMRGLDRLVMAWPRVQVGAIVASPVVLMFSLVDLPAVHTYGLVINFAIASAVLILQLQIQALLIELGRRVEIRSIWWSAGLVSLILAVMITVFRFA